MQVGLTVAVVVGAVVLVLAMVIGGEDTPAGGETTAIRAVTDTVITTPGSAEPKAVVSIYEDFLCPACRNYEMEFGQTINDLIDSGAVAADYTMVAILDRPTNQNHSSRAGAAAYCVADEDTTSDKPAFRRFYAALYAQQPSETDTTFPTDDQLIEIARQAGADSSVRECVTSGQYLNTVKGTAAASEVNATPTIRINGEDYTPTTPAALIAKIRSITG
ncbi:protein-disulfide isomerase [Mycolicibacterium tokaiense]|uniref:Protein-disulfide isomerase n=1 Tax=Mycolicibacterium tokaiense TaxID=39695 RepID=A0A378TIM9_9MYCO|nr:membrane protein [Mycolicibacterium tokaiense]STZ59663.1 protein-disulfide isomerase [Mycolicibacterium tokaiense]